MSSLKGVNVTKYDAGGSGDNVISDGYIKTVEKVWLDSYTVGTTALGTDDTITIATIPANKKITGVEVIYPALTTEGSGTGSTINVGISGDATKFINAAEAGVAVGTLYPATALTKATMNNADGMQYVTTAETDILLSIGRKAATTTSCTIKTIVRYT